MPYFWRLNHKRLTVASCHPFKHSSIAKTTKQRAEKDDLKQIELGYSSLPPPDTYMIWYSVTGSTLQCPMWPPSHPQYFDRLDLRLFGPKESHIKWLFPTSCKRCQGLANLLSNLCSAPADCSVKAQYSCIYPWGSKIGVKGFLPRSRPGKAVSVARLVRAPDN